MGRGRLVLSAVCAILLSPAQLKNAFDGGSGGLASHRKKTEAAIDDPLLRPDFARGLVPSHPQAYASGPAGPISLNRHHPSFSVKNRFQPTKNGPTVCTAAVKGLAKERITGRCVPMAGCAKTLLDARDSMVSSCGTTPVCLVVWFIQLVWFNQLNKTNQITFFSRRLTDYPASRVPNLECACPGRSLWDFSELRPCASFYRRTARPT